MDNEDQENKEGECAHEWEEQQYFGGGVARLKCKKCGEWDYVY